MEYYARDIRNFERELNISVTEFPQFGLIGLKMPHEPGPEGVFDYGHSLDQTQVELEAYESLVKQNKNLTLSELNRNLYLLKEQARDKMGSDSNV